MRLSGFVCRSRSSLALRCDRSSHRGATGPSPMARRDGGELAQDGRSGGLAGAGLLHPVPSAEDCRYPDPVPSRGWRAEPAGRQHRGEDARRWRVAGAAAMARAGGGNGARSTWPWTWRPGTCVGWSSPPARQATARSFQTCWRRSRPTCRSAPSRRHRHGGWRLRYPDLPLGHRRAGRHRVRRGSGPPDRSLTLLTPDPQDRPRLERGRPRRRGQDRDPASLEALRPGPLDAAHRLPCPTSHHGSDAPPESLRRTHRLTKPRPPSRQAAKIHTRIALMNRFSALGRAEIVRVS